MNFVRITTRAQSTIEQQRKTLPCQRSSSSSSSSHLKRELGSYKLMLILNFKCDRTVGNMYYCTIDYDRNASRYKTRLDIY